MSAFLLFQRGTFRAVVPVGSRVALTLAKTLKPTPFNADVPVCDCEGDHRQRHRCINGEILSQAPNVESAPADKVKGPRKLKAFPKQDGLVVVGSEWFGRGGVIARLDAYAVPKVEEHELEEKSAFPDTLGASLVILGPVTGRDCESIDGMDSARLIGGDFGTLRYPFDPKLLRHVDKTAVFAQSRGTVGILCQDGALFMLGVNR